MTDATPTIGPLRVPNIYSKTAATRTVYENVLGWDSVKRRQNGDNQGEGYDTFSITPAAEPGSDGINPDVAGYRGCSP